MAHSTCPQPSMISPTIVIDEMQNDPIPRPLLRPMNSTSQSPKSARAEDQPSIAAVPPELTSSSDRFVSVILPTRDRAAYLQLSLASWCHQRYANYEIVLVDDGSTDSTFEVVKKYKTRLPLRYLRIEKKGRAGARNSGVAAARGDVFIFVDDDRLVDAFFLAAHVRALAKSPAPSVIFGWQRGIMTDLEPGRFAELDIRDNTLKHRVKMGEALSLAACRA